MRKTALPDKRGPQEGTIPHGIPEKCGWIRKYCGRGIFRELWKSRYVTLKMDHVYISEKEVKDEKSALERFDLSDYDKCEELRKSKSRSKKNQSKFTLVGSRQPGNTVPNLIFLALSPEEKESWISALSAALGRAKNRILDEVTVDEECLLAHPTRDRAKIQHARRPPTRGHLTAVASTSTSDGMLTLDLIQEDEGDPGARDVKGGPEEPAARLGLHPEPEALPSSSEAGLDEGPLRTGLGPGTGPGSDPGARLRHLVALRLQRTERLLLESESGPQGEGRPRELAAASSALLQARGLLAEALANWSQAQRVLEEIGRLCGELEAERQWSRSGPADKGLA